jgi:hypothetical protein
MLGNATQPQAKPDTLAREGALQLAREHSD